MDFIHGNDANDGFHDGTRNDGFHDETRHDGFHDETRNDGFHNGFHDGRPCLQTTNDGTNATESGIYARVNAESTVHGTDESLEFGLIQLKSLIRIISISLNHFEI